MSQPVATAALNTNIKVTAAFGTIVAIVATVAAATGKTKSTIEPDDPHRVVQVGRAFACGDDESVAPLTPGQRWSLGRKREVVLRLMQGEPVEALSRRLGLPVYKLEEWRQRGLAGIDAGAA